MVCAFDPSPALGVVEFAAAANPHGPGSAAVGELVGRRLGFTAIVNAPEAETVSGWKIAIADAELVV